MTQEEKARRCDEALERAKEEWKNNLDNAYKNYRERLEIIFPELKESEDERMWKGIIQTLKRYTKCVEEGHDAPSVKDFLVKDTEKQIAWLENQTEIDEELIAKKFLIDKGFPIDANGTFPTFEELYDIIKMGLEKQDSLELDMWKEGDVVRHGSILALVTNGRKAIKLNLEQITIQYPYEWVKVNSKERKYFFEEFEKHIQDLIEKQGERKLLTADDCLEALSKIRNK